MTEPASGWITASAAEPEAEPEPEDVEDVEPTGPTEPDTDIPAPDLVDQLPTRPAQSRTKGKHWYLSAHGGAGSSTLAELDDQGADARGVWPTHRNGQNVVVVARETVRGLTAACHLATQWRAGKLPGVHVLALVTVPAQPGRPTLDILQHMKIAAGVFPRHYRTEWHPEYMNHIDPHDATPAKKDQRVIRTIHKISTREG